MNSDLYLLKYSPEYCRFGKNWDVMPKMIEQKLIEEFKGREYFSREELFAFYRFYEPELNRGTFGWRIFDLKNKNILKPVKRGLYVLAENSEYKPEISTEIVKLAKQVTEKFKDVKHCIWETKWLHEFSQHQASRRMLLVEIEKDFTESLFYELKDSARNDVFLNPDDKVIDLYVAESSYPVIIKKLISRSPLVKREKDKAHFYGPALEKILVDLFAEEKLFSYVQGSELISIYENVIRSYTINFTKLFSYAKRREKEQQIKLFMTNHMDHLTKDLIG